MTSSGEMDLTRLLTTLQPKLQPGEYVFVTLPKAEGGGWPEVAVRCLPHVVGTFVEEEGITLIVPLTTCGGLPDGTQRSAPQRMITLECHSSLEAVGLTYRVSQRLASLGISCNVVAAYYHDHIFVAVDRAELACEALCKLQADAKVEVAVTSGK